MGAFQARLNAPFIVLARAWAILKYRVRYMSSNRLN